MNIREQLVEYGRRLSAGGLCPGSGGNVSAREGDRIWMKPSNMALDELTADQLCALRITDGAVCAGDVLPTSEYRLHLAIYRVRPDVHAVFHAHPPWLTGLISAGVPFKALTIDAVGYLGRIVHLPYVLPQSAALAKQVEDAVRAGDTLLLSNHGIVTTGHDSREAFHRARVAESAAQCVIAASMVGKPQYLTDRQISEISGA